MLQPQYTITLDPERVSNTPTPPQPVVLIDGLCSIQSVMRIPFPEVPILQIQLQRHIIEADNKRCDKMFSFDVGGVPAREQWLHQHPEVKQELLSSYKDLALGRDISLGSFTQYLHEDDTI